MSFTSPETVEFYDAPPGSEKIYPLGDDQKIDLRKSKAFIFKKSFIEMPFLLTILIFANPQCRNFRNQNYSSEKVK